MSRDRLDDHFTRSGNVYLDPILLDGDDRATVTASDGSTYHLRPSAVNLSSMLSSMLSGRWGSCALDVSGESLTRVLALMCCQGQVIDDPGLREMMHYLLVDRTRLDIIPAVDDEEGIMEYAKSHPGDLNPFSNTYSGVEVMTIDVARVMVSCSYAVYHGDYYWDMLEKIEGTDREPISSLVRIISRPEAVTLEDIARCSIKKLSMGICKDLEGLNIADRVLDVASYKIMTGADTEKRYVNWACSEEVGSWSHRVLRNKNQKLITTYLTRTAHMCSGRVPDG